MKIQIGGFNFETHRKSKQRKKSTHIWVKFLLGLQSILIIFLVFFAFELRVQPVGMAYSDWIAVLLTGVAVIISVLAVFLGVLAFVGWQTFDRRVRQRTEEVISEGLAVNGNLRTILENALERASYDIAGADNDRSSNDKIDA